MASPVRVSVTVNGTHQTAEVEPRLLLVHFLRDTLGLTGTHVGCDTSNCGACTCHLNGEAVKSCTVLAVQADGAEVTTIEGMGQEGNLHPLQEAFWEHHGLQCGYCTPGMIMAAADLLDRNPSPSEEQVREGLASDGTLHPVQEGFWEHHGLQCGYCTPGMIMAGADLLAKNPDPSEEEVREALAGNLCRCTGYHNIVKAVQDAAAAVRGGATVGTPQEGVPA